ASRARDGGSRRARHRCSCVPRRPRPGFTTSCASGTTRRSGSGSAAGIAAQEAVPAALAGIEVADRAELAARVLVELAGLARLDRALRRALLRLLQGSHQRLDALALLLGDVRLLAGILGRPIELDRLEPARVARVGGDDLPLFEVAPLAHAGEHVALVALLGEDELGALIEPAALHSLG